jgi:phosphoserine phosphatase RsbU/P
MKVLELEKLVKKLIFLVILAAGCIAQAQGPLWIDLSGPWRISLEDRPEFAQTSFDDHAWKTTEMPGGMPYIRSGLTVRGWLRCRVELPPGTDLTQLALTLGVITQSRYEVFIDGARLPSSDNLTPPLDLWMPRPQTHPITVDGPHTGDSMEIAIHFASIGMNPIWRIPDTGPFLLTSQSNAPANVGASAIAMQLTHVDGPLYFTVGAFLILAALCIVAWFGDRSRTELLWFTLIALERVWYSAWELAAFSPAHSELPGLLDFANEFLALPLLGEMVLASLGIQHRRWFRALIWVCALPIFLMPLVRTPFLRFLGNPFPWAVSSCIALGLLIIGIVLHNWWSLRHAKLSLEEHLLRLAFVLPCLQNVAFWAGYLPGYDLFSLTLPGPLPIRPFKFDSTWFIIALVIFVLLMRRTLADRRAQQRMAQELEAARQVQHLLVSCCRTMVDPFYVETAYLPAQEVGGDFYYILDGRVLIVGDVSGKGLKAAMLVSLLIGVLLDTPERSPGKVLAAMNNALIGQTDGGFVTCACARFDDTGLATIANAGHLPPYLDGSEAKINSSLPLGIVSGLTYDETSLSVAPNSILTFVSDGVVEAANARRELFGFDRTREISTASARDIVESARAWGQNDDITVVTVRHKS